MIHQNHQPLPPPDPHPSSEKRRNSLLQRIIIANTPLHSRTLRNSRNPLLDMREVLHLLLGEARPLPALDPRPGLDVGHAVLALAVAGQVLARLARVLAGQLDLEHAVDAQGFFLEALDGVGDFLGGGAGEVVYLAWREGVCELFCFVLFWFGGEIGVELFFGFWFCLPW